MEFSGGRKCSVFAWNESGRGLTDSGTNLRVSFRSMDSASVRSLTNFRCMALAALRLFFLVMSSPALFTWSSKPRSLMRTKNSNRPGRVPWGPAPILGS